jgi:AcrR family transcriptional regulator
MPSARTPVVTPQEMGRREHRKHVTRLELLAAGRQLFGEQGLYDCRIEDLTRHAGIAKGTIYGYFESKEELMKAVVATGFDEMLGKVHRETAQARDRRETVARAAQAHLEFLRANPDLMRIFHQVRGLLKYKRPEGRPLRRVLQGYLSGLAQVLARPGAPDALEPGVALECATAMLGSVSGISSLVTSLGDPVPRPFDTPQIAAAVTELVMTIAGGPGPGAPAQGAPRRTRSRTAHAG